MACCASRCNCPPGPAGPPGEPGGVEGFSNFFALMGPNNTAPIAPGSPIEFPQDGPFGGTGVTRQTISSFNVLVAGVYEITWQASVAEAGQLVVAVSSGGGPFVEQLQTVVGRATDTSQIVGSTLLTLAFNDLVRIQNPAGNAAALTLTPLAGGTLPVSATLTFIRMS